MAFNRESVDRLLMQVREKRDEAEAVAGQARDALARMTIEPLDELNPETIESAADDLAANVRALKLYTEVAAQLRSLLI